MRHNTLIGGGRPVFYAAQPYFLKHAPQNPAFGTVHDGVSTEFCAGFSAKPIHWLYRFRHNTAPYCATPLNLRNRGDKVAHWLEITQFKKVAAQLSCSEAYPHMFTAIAIVMITIWHCGRYLLYHPELTLYNVAMYPTKSHIEQTRYNERHPMDKPVFRWVQRCPEFYSYDSYRELIDMEVIANDPFIEHMKALGKGDQLTAYPEEGYNNNVKHLKKEYRYSHGYNAAH